MSEPQYHLAMSGEAPNGESFEVSLYFNSEDHLDHRIDRIVEAARKAMTAIVDPGTTVDPADKHFGGDILRATGVSR